MAFQALVYHAISGRTSIGYLPCITASSPKWGAIVPTLIVFPWIKQAPTRSNRFTEHLRGQRLQLRKCAYASLRFREASVEERSW